MVQNQRKWECGSLKGVNAPVKFGERTRNCSPGQAGKEGPHLSLTGASCGISRTAAPVWVFSRGTMGYSGSLLCGTREVSFPADGSQVPHTNKINWPLWTTLGLGAATFHSVKNLYIICSWPSVFGLPSYMRFLHIQDSTSADLTYCKSCNSIVFTIEKIPPVSGLEQSNPFCSRINCFVTIFWQGKLKYL